MNRTTDGSGPVDSFSLRELQGLDAGYRHGTPDGHRFRANGVRIPALEEVVTTYPDVRMVLDLKRDGLTEPLIRLIERYGLHERAIVGSFSDQRLSEFRKATGGKVATSTGPTVSRLWVLASRVGRRGERGASALQLPTRVRGVDVVDERLVATAHSAGMQVHVWTVNRTSEMERYLDVGVDGIVSDRPDLLKGVLMRRGEWRGL